jgi:hypothetical protein
VKANIKLEAHIWSQNVLEAEPLLGLRGKSRIEGVGCIAGSFY